MCWSPSRSMQWSVVSKAAERSKSVLLVLEIFLTEDYIRAMDNKLKLNNEKTEALLLCSSSMSFSVSKPTTISVCGCEISFSSPARNLGFFIRDDLRVE